LFVCVHNMGLRSWVLRLPDRKTLEELIDWLKKEAATTFFYNGFGIIRWKKTYWLLCSSDGNLKTNPPSQWMLLDDVPNDEGKIQGARYLDEEKTLKVLGSVRNKDRLLFALKGQEEPPQVGGTRLNDLD